MTTPTQILRLMQVIARTGLKRSTIYDRMNSESPRFDPNFPKPIKIGVSAIGWIESEIGSWIEMRIAASRPADDSTRNQKK